MTVIRWLGVLLVLSGGFSNSAMAARAPSAPAATALRGPTGQPPSGQTPETRIAAVVNDEVISVADVRSRLRMVMLSSNLADSPDTQPEAEVRNLAVRLSEQMHQGARFSAVAQQFSQSATAAVGGDIGWIRPEQLSPELGKAVAQMRPGELSPPIRTGAGYYLLLVLDRRLGRSPGPDDTLLHLVQIVFPLPVQAPEAMRRAAILEAQNAKTTAKNCEELLKIGKEKGSPQLSSEGRLRVDQISPAMRSLVLGLEPGQASQPIVQKNGVGVIMVCEKAAPSAPTIPTREEIGETLMRQRLETLARRYMRDLRRTAFVDVRL